MSQIRLNDIAELKLQIRAIL